MGTCSKKVAALKLQKSPVYNYMGIDKVILLISISLAVFLTSLPYLKQDLLIGWDTPYYLYLINYVEKYGIQATLIRGDIDRPFYALTLYVLHISGLSPEVLLKIIPPLFSSFYILSIYLLVREGLVNNFAAAISSLLVACSFSLLRLANELHSNLLALTLTMLGIWLYLMYVNNGRRKFLFFLMIIEFFILGIHAFTYGIFTCVLLISFLAHRKTCKVSEISEREKKGLLVLLLPLFVFITILAFYSFAPILGVFESLFNSRVIFPLMSMINARNVIFQSIPELIPAALGLIFLKTKDKASNLFQKILFCWFSLFILFFIVCLLLGIMFAYRFVLLLPLPILGALAFTHWPSRVGLKLRNLFLIGIVTVSFFSCTFHQLYYTRSWIDKELKSELEWVKKSFGDKLIIPVYPLNSATGYWVLGIIGDYVYYGEVLPLLARKFENYPKYPNLDPQIYWEKLERDGVLDNLTEYKIILIDGVYEISPIDRQLVEKVAGHNIYVVKTEVVRDELKIDYYYGLWRKFKDVKIAIVGSEGVAVFEILSNIWISPVPTWLSPHPNLFYLGKLLPSKEALSDYDLLILANWTMREFDDKILLNYFHHQHGIIFTGYSAFSMYQNYSDVLEEILGVIDVHPPNIQSFNYTYVTSHFITRNFSLPFCNAEVISGVTVTNSSAIGIASVNSQRLYMLTVREENSVRTAHFGLTISDMNEIDIFIFKRLIFWVLNLEECFNEVH